jgi:hypothetical protein
MMIHSVYASMISILGILKESDLDRIVRLQYRSEIRMRLLLIGRKKLVKSVYPPDHQVYKWDIRISGLSGCHPDPEVLIGILYLGSVDVIHAVSIVYYL